MSSPLSTADTCTLSARVVLQRELRQLEVVRREQRERAVAVVQVARDGAGERQAVEGGRAAADLVHQHQRLVGGAVQDGGRLGHLEHEGRLRVGQVVGRADAGVDRVDRARAGSAWPARTSPSPPAARSAPPGA